MRWTNPSRPGFSQSQQFGKNQLNRNSRPPPQFKETDLSTQKNLIYDLRSELSNLKNQFTRLISNPNEADYKPRRETFDIPHEQPQVSPQPRLSYNEREKTPYHLENISNNLKRHNENDFTPLGKGHSRSSSFTSADKNAPQPPSSINNDLISENQIHKIGPFKHQIQNQKGPEKQNISARYSFNDQSFHRQKQKEYLKIKLQQNTFTPNHRAPDRYSSGTEQLQKDSHRTQLQSKLRQKQQQNERQRIKIEALTQQIAQVSYSKAKEMESMRQIVNKVKQSMKNQLQQQKDRLFKKSETQRAKNEEIIHQLREDKKMVQKELRQLKQKFQIDIETQVRKTKNQHYQAIKQQQKAHDRQIQQLQQKLHKKNEFIKDLLAQRQSERQMAKLQKEKIPEKTELGVNTQQPQKNEQIVMSLPQPQDNSQKLAEALGDKEKQIKQMQDKIKLYLNNIDKQNSKIKDFKIQLQLSQKFAAETQFIINEKQTAIHNILNQLKNAEKEIQEQNRARKALQSLLQASDHDLVLHRVGCLNRKYIEQEE